VGGNAEWGFLKVTNVMSLVDSDNDGFIDAKEFNAFFNFCAQAIDRWKWRRHSGLRDNNIS
jgi:hypothetical protein